MKIYEILVQIFSHLDCINILNTIDKGWKNYSESSRLIKGFSRAILLKINVLENNELVSTITYFFQSTHVLNHNLINKIKTIY